MKTRFFYYFKKQRQKIRRRAIQVLRSRWTVTLFIIFFLGVTSFGIANYAYIYFLKKNNINIFQIKNLILQFIKTELNKAIEIGAINANILDGISLTEMKISAEEDFSNNKILFSADKVDLKLSSAFSKSLHLERIVFYNSKLELEPNFEVYKFSKYLLEKNLPSIEFKNLTLTIKKENENVIRTTKPLHLILHRRKDTFIIQGSDAIFFKKFFKQLDIQGQWDLTSKTLKFKIEVQNFPAEKIYGILKSTSFIETEEGKVEGFIHYETSDEETKVDGNLDLYSISGSFLGNYKIPAFNFNTKFSYLSNEAETYFNRKLNNPHFILDIAYHKKENSEVVQRISGSFLDLEKLNWLTEEEREETKVKGKIQFDLNIEEFPQENEAFHFYGNFYLEEVFILSKDSKLNLFIKEGGITAEPSGKLKGSLKGSLFSEKFEAELFGNLKYIRAREPEFFIVHSNLESNLKLQKYIHSEFEAIWNKLMSAIEASIREQQEKMYTETYIIAQPFFKKFFERANLQFQLEINSFQNSKEEGEMGAVVGNFKYSNNNFNFKLTSKQEPHFLNVDLRGMIDRRNPYYDLRASLKNYPWKKIFLEFCGYGIFPKEIDLDLSLQTSGNNFSDMLSRKSINLEFEIRNFEWKLQNPIIASEFFIFKIPNWTTKGGFSGYGFEGYFRNLELFSETTNFKGFGSTAKQGSFQFNFWGVNSGTYTNWGVIINGGEKCQFTYK